MSLATVLTADPVEALAQDLADDCARLAQKSVAVYTRDEALKSMRELKPTLAVIGCELGGDQPVDFFETCGMHHQTPRSSPLFESYRCR